jgi:hypothetical protein
MATDWGQAHDRMRAAMAAKATELKALGAELFYIEDGSVFCEFVAVLKERHNGIARSVKIVVEDN